MHLSNDALHRILSVPTVNTAAVVSYRFQDLWVSPAAVMTAGLTPLEASQRISDGIFWRLEPIVFCDQNAKNLGESIEFQQGFRGVMSSASQYPSQYELTCRTGMLEHNSETISYGTPLLQKSNPYGSTTLSEEVGQSTGTIPYIYKPIKVSRVAFTKLTEWKHGFSIYRTVDYKNEEDRCVIDYSNSNNDEVRWLTTSDTIALYNKFQIAPIGLDEGGGTIDEKFFTFSPKFDDSELSSVVLQTLTEPNAIGWNYTPLETKTTSQPFPTNTTNQAEYIVEQTIKLFPLENLQTSPVGYNLHSAEVQYLRDTATNYCSQFDWASQARDFDAVALRQRRLLDFNAIPIAPLELGKDYATLATSPDMGLQSYGDLPAIAWAPDPADESKVFALCRYRPPIRVPLPSWEWRDIKLMDEISNCYYYEQVGENRFEPRMASLGSKLPFKWLLLKSKDNLSVYPHNAPLLTDLNPEKFDIKIISKFSAILPFPDLVCYFEKYLTPLKFGMLQGENYHESGAEMCNSFYPAFSKKQAVQLAPRFVRMDFAFPYLTPAPLPPPPQEPPTPPDPDIVNFLTATVVLIKEENPYGKGVEYRKESIVYCEDPQKKFNAEEHLEDFRLWANDFFLSESNYTEIGRYRWLDENGTPMVDEPFFGHSEIFNSFNIDIRLTPAPA